MKRLLLNCLFGCIMMGQLHAGDLTVPAHVWKFVGAAAATAIPAVIGRASIVAKNNQQARSNTPVALTAAAVKYHIPFNRIVLSESCLWNGEGCNVIGKATEPEAQGKAFHQQERTNRWTAAFLATMFAAGVARLSANYLPENLRDYVVRAFSMPTAAGIAFGAGIPLWFLLPHLRHDRVQKEDGTYGDCNPRALRRKYYPTAPNQTLSPWENMRRTMFAL